MNKTLTICFLTLVLFVFNGCKKTKEEVDEITEFDINYSSSVSVPSNTISLNTPVNFTTPEIPTASAGHLATNKTTQSLVESIKLTLFNVSVGTDNLDFLKSLTIYIKASGMSETLVASKNNIPSGITSIALDLNDVNIKEYIFQPGIQFRVALEIDASTLNGQTLILDQTVHVKATIIK
ncbi:MAG: hypothetical protein IPM51_14225 [Sphingobacteriaceae bacterium]|nr:hypothetical protein [Sphingobacteriaceae bacterium]